MELLNFQQKSKYQTHPILEIASNGNQTKFVLNATWGTGTLVDWAENASGEENFSPFLLNKTSKILAISTLSFVNSIHTIGFAIQ